MPHIMIDLETMGTRPGSAILSIGACSFDPNWLGGSDSDHEPGEARRTFYQNITLASCLDAGLTIDAATEA